MRSEQQRQEQEKGRSTTTDQAQQIGIETCAKLERQYQANFDILQRRILSDWFGSENATQYVFPYRKPNVRIDRGNLINNAEIGRIIAAHIRYIEHQRRMKKGIQRDYPYYGYNDKPENYEEVDQDIFIPGAMFIQFGVGYVNGRLSYILTGVDYNRRQIQTFFIDEEGAQGQFIQAISRIVDQDRETVDRCRNAPGFVIQPATENMYLEKDHPQNAARVQALEDEERRKREQEKQQEPPTYDQSYWAYWTPERIAQEKKRVKELGKRAWREREERRRAMAHQGSMKIQWIILSIFLAFCVLLLILYILSR